MDYKLSFEPCEKYLYARVEGEYDNYKISKAFWTEIITEAKAKGFEKILIEEDLIETVSMEEIFQLVSEFSEMGVNDHIVAFVDNRADHHTINAFAELVAVNAGLHGKLFNNLSDAKEWLLAQ